MTPNPPALVTAAARPGPAATFIPARKIGCFILKSLVRGVVIVVIFTGSKCDVIDGLSREASRCLVFLKVRGGEPEEFSLVNGAVGSGPVDPRDAKIIQPGWHSLSFTEKCLFSGAIIYIKTLKKNVTP